MGVGLLLRGGIEAFNSSGTKKEGAEPDSVGKVPRLRWGGGGGGVNKMQLRMGAVTDLNLVATPTTRVTKTKG